MKIKLNNLFNKFNSYFEVSKNSKIKKQENHNLLSKDHKEKSTLNIKNYFLVQNKYKGVNSGGIYQSKLKKQKFNNIFVKNDAPEVIQAELIAAHILKLFLGNQTPLYSFIKINRSQIALAEEFIEFLLHYNDLQSNNIQEIESLGKILATSFAIGDIKDLHATNLCAIEENNKFKAIKIDHGRAFEIRLKDGPQGQASNEIKSIIERCKYPTKIFTNFQFKHDLEQMLSVVGIEEEVDKALSEIQIYFKGINKNFIKKINEVCGEENAFDHKNIKDGILYYIQNTMVRIKELHSIVIIEELIYKNDIKGLVKFLEDPQLNYLLFIPINWMTINGCYNENNKQLFTLAEYITCHYSTNYDLHVAVRELQNLVFTQNQYFKPNLHDIAKIQIEFLNNEIAKSKNENIKPLLKINTQNINPRLQSQLTPLIIPRSNKSNLRVSITTPNTKNYIGLSPTTLHYNMNYKNSPNESPTKSPAKSPTKSHYKSQFNSSTTVPQNINFSNSSGPGDESPSKNYSIKPRLSMITTNSNANIASSVSSTPSPNRINTLSFTNEYLSMPNENRGLISSEQSHSSINQSSSKISMTGSEGRRRYSHTTATINLKKPENKY